MEGIQVVIGNDVAGKDALCSYLEYYLYENWINLCVRVSWAEQSLYLYELLCIFMFLCPSGVYIMLVHNYSLYVSIQSLFLSPWRKLLKL